MGNDFCDYIVWIDYCVVIVLVECFDVVVDWGMDEKVFLLVFEFGDFLV